MSKSPQVLTGMSNSQSVVVATTCLSVVLLLDDIQGVISPCFLYELLLQSQNFGLYIRRYII
jgi:hypothetical protein